jgi:Fe-S-cluster-containing dehydrogenase component
MGCDRRTFLKGVAVATATAVTPASTARADNDKRVLPPEAIGLLYDATRCIGCKACVVACKKANDLAPDTHYVGDGLYDAPEGLNEHTKTVIQLYKDDDEMSFVKKQCMHCIDPACVNACMIGALKKEADTGLVWWRSDRCVGCRYCQVACPFQVPKFEWTKQVPKIVKCELCKHRLADGGQPACTEICPRQAGVFSPTRTRASRRIPASTTRRSTARRSWAARSASISRRRRRRSRTSDSTTRRRKRSRSRRERCSTGSTRDSSRRRRSTLRSRS